MRALILVGALVVLALTVWLTIRLVRRARVDAAVNAPWRVEHRASGGVTTVEVVRRSETGRLLSSVVVADIPDSDPEWLNRRAAAMEEARQRVTELNAANEETDL